MQKPNHPTAALLIIGAEILSGKVEDENGPFLIRALRNRGVRLAEIRVLDDVVDVISKSVRQLHPLVTHLFTTGGIGPTHDDVTISAIADALGRKVVRHPDLIRKLEERYGDQLNEARLRLAEIPEGATMRLAEPVPVPVITVENVTIFPGVPALMRLCFEQVADTLSSSQIFSRSIFVNRSEGDLAGPLRRIQQAHPDVAIGSYPRYDDAPYRVKVTIDGHEEGAVDRALEAIQDDLRPEWIVGEP